MPRQYSLKSFLRNVKNSLLKEYLDSKNVDVNEDWENIKEAKIDPIFDAIESASESTRSEIDSDFRIINEMGSEGARKTIIDEASYHGLDLSEALSEMDDHLDAAFWTFLNHPVVFDVASQFNHADNLPGRSWRKRIDLPIESPSTDADSEKRLGEEIACYYRRKEGRGRICHVEHYKRGDRYYWFAYPQDYSTTAIEYDDSGAFDRRVHRPAFEIIFVHEPDIRTLDLYVKGNHRVVSDLQDIWGNEILGLELGPAQRRGQIYELDHLKDRNFDFAVRPESGIESVRIKRMRLRIPGRENKRIMIEGDVRQNSQVVYDLLDAIMESSKISLKECYITQAGFQIIFRDDGKPGSKTLNFDVSYPNSCSLKHDPKHEIAKEYLIEWGIDIS